MIDSRLPLGLDRLSRTLAQTSTTLEGLLSSHDSTEPFGNDVVRLDDRNRIDFAHRNTPAVECHEIIQEITRLSCDNKFTKASHPLLDGIVDMYVPRGNDAKKQMRRNPGGINPQLTILGWIAALTFVRRSLRQLTDFEAISFSAPQG
jgi:hypothetical protein